MRAAMHPNTYSLSMAMLLMAASACDSSPVEPTADAAKKPATAKTTLPAPKAAEAKQLSARALAKPKPEPRPVAVKTPKDVAEAPKTAKKEKSGLKSVVLTKGSGKDKPRPNDTVKVHYSGWTKDGKMFDSSVARGKPTEFRVGGVIKGWQEGLQLMVVGEKRRFWIPAELAYGNRGGFGPKGQLTFDVELLEVKKGPEPPEVPKDLLKPPKDAKKTKSGLVYRVLKKGDGKTHPQASDRVQVHYSGWSKDGKMFDSSVMRARPTSFPLQNVIKGWTEGVQLMTTGAKFRFWIPAELAYGAKPKRRGTPAGDLVFDVELLKIF
jgi:FKBP-type peptidyl-prolyl cis-trans isomerase